MQRFFPRLDPDNYMIKHLRERHAGSYRKIPVLIDSGESEELLPILSEALERELITPREEKIFELVPIDKNDFSRLKNARTSIVIASLESPGPAGRMIRGALSPDAIKAIESNMRWIIVKKDLWAEGQIVIFITAPNLDALSVQLGLGKDRLFSLINDSVNDRVSKWLFEDFFGEGEKLALEDSVAEDYGFGIKIPRFFNWEKGRGEEKFIWLRALEPERWVFVWWTDMDSEVEYNIGWWRHVRDSLCRIYYEGDSVARHCALKMEGDKIGGRPVVGIRGLWENSENHLGGPFVSYVLSDPVTRRIFIVDGAVFAPVVKKEPYLRHVEIICKSFRGDLPQFYSERQ